MITYIKWFLIGFHCPNCIWAKKNPMSIHLKSNICSAQISLSIFTWLLNYIYQEALKYIWSTIIQITATHPKSLLCLMLSLVFVIGCSLFQSYITKQHLGTICSLHAMAFADFPGMGRWCHAFIVRSAFAVSKLALVRCMAKFNAVKLAPHVWRNKKIIV